MPTHKRPRCHDDALALWGYLEENCVGKGRAIKQRSVAALLGMSTRKIRALTRVLGDRYGKPVASTVNYPYGIYVPYDTREAVEYVAQLDARIKALLDRRDAFKGSVAGGTFTREKLA